MKLDLSKNRIALHVALAITAGVVTIGCASNGDKQTQTTGVPDSAVTVTSAINENPVAETTTEIKPEVEQHIATAQSVETAVTSAEVTTQEVTYPDIESKQNVKPEQLSFQFSFDKAELSDTDKQVITQHAHFLLDNPEMVLRIQGHTDHHGPRVYNEYLSKKRAEAVARILIEEGVQESQLEIIALANDKPLADIKDTRLNRRVELDYSEMNLVSNK